MPRIALSEQALDERKDQIKSAALKVFAEKGLTGTKMSMIAEEAGISQGLSYKYFESKDEIFALLVEEAIEEAQKAIRNIGQLSGSPIDQLRAFTLRMLDENHKHYFLLIQQAQKSEGVPHKAKEAIKRYSPGDTIDLMIPIVVRGQEEGQLAEGDPYKRLLLFLSVVTGLMLQDTKALGIDLALEVDYLLGILTK
ncbi:TetR/AcrR family transcriptional regulator [Paenibacillus rhizovicinus]|uniref:TetR/AcrR family transcriptional regulator n=1 Tax=Paenibacillus rhizovicinus TaxID=2704463 RepID=A0A6C0NUS2_9BACL|nr:TetR/AcrR family transcriptional regulator [Paenibacillus rhizovicinus]QHW29493.1 TetR/AcrR family transcriptional regulator [Paenibacillus rhizovicinus]